MFLINNLIWFNYFSNIIKINYKQTDNTRKDDQNNSIYRGLDPFTFKNP